MMKKQNIMIVTTVATMLSLTACSQQGVVPNASAGVSHNNTAVGGRGGNVNNTSRGGAGRSRAGGTRGSGGSKGYGASTYGINTGGGGIKNGRQGGGYYGNGKGGGTRGGGGTRNGQSNGANGTHGKDYYSGGLGQGGQGGYGGASSALGGNNAITIANLKNPKSILAKRVIYFDYNQSTVKAEYQAVLNAHAQLLAKNPQLKVRLEGHADERGTREYNVALSEERAKKVQWLMKAKGLKANQSTVIAYGEERPAVIGDGERSWAKNRRVEIKY